MAAPVAQIDIQKVMGNEYWTNRYLTDLAVGTAEAEALATLIAEAEQDFLYNVVTIDKIRIATLTPGDDVFQVWNPALVGTRTFSAGTLLPLFNVVRIDFGAGLGRPSRKYFRGALAEVDVDGNVLTNTFRTGPAAAYATAIADAPNIVDPQGSELIGFSVSIPIGMRQLRRGSRRRSEPVL